MGADIEKIVLSYLPEIDGFQKTAIDAMHDAVKAGGKRVRPRIMYETYVMFCKKYGKTPDEKVIGPFMAGMEIMHTASLIHDDLPCMDNDTLRRGKPTTWVTYGVDMATLTGDAMMIEALSMMADAVTKMDDKAAGSKAVAVMAKKSGLFGMTGGQVVDVENTGKPVTKEQLEYIYKNKTGALLEASMMIGAILGGADDEETAVIEKVAGDVGMAFQIRDDVLDEISSAEKLGKPIHSDAENNKTTYVTLYGIERANEEVKRCSDEAVELLESLNCEAGEISKIIKALIDRDK